MWNEATKGAVNVHIGISGNGNAPNSSDYAPIAPNVNSSCAWHNPVCANFQTFWQKKVARVLLILYCKNSGLCTDAQML